MKQAGAFRPLSEFVYISALPLTAPVMQVRRGCHLVELRIFSAI